MGHKRDHADWKALLADAGVRDARLHDARHTAAYQLTMNTYSHVAPELNSEAARLMAGALWEDEADDEGAPRRRSGE